MQSPKLFPYAEYLIEKSLTHLSHISSVIRQKGESQNGCYKKSKHAKFSENRTFLAHWYAHVVSISAGKKCSFFVLCFPRNTRFEIRPFALLPAISATSLWSHLQTREVKTYTSTDNIKNFSLQYNITFQNFTKKMCTYFEVKSHHAEKWSGQLRKTNISILILGVTLSFSEIFFWIEATDLVNRLEEM